MHYEKIYLHENRKDVSLTVYALGESREMPGSKSRGAVIICPGGAYLGCSDREGEPVAMAFAAMGYHAFVLRYSVYDQGGDGLNFPDISKPLPLKPHCVFPNPMRDIGRAMLLIRSRAAEWHVDTNKIALCGFSAGGHNCAMYSVYWDKPIMTEHFAVAAEDLRPAACIMAYPLTDYVLMGESVMRASGGDSMHTGLFRAANMAFAGTEIPSAEFLQQISPARLIDKNMPATFLWSTSEDSLVPIQQTTAMAMALAENNIPFEMHIFEKGPHGISLATEASAGSVEHLDSDAAKWVELCAMWLGKRFN